MLLKNSRLYHLHVYLLACCFILSCSPTHVHMLDPEGFEESIANTPDALLIDVRTPEEFNEGHLAGAVNYNLHDPNFRAHLATLNKDKAVYVYCSKGKRSDHTAEILDSLGFKHIYDLSGGYTNWESEGLPVQK